MKKLLFISGIIAIVHTANGQAGIYHKDTTVEKNCFDEYYEAFITRGAYPVPDGEHNVVYSLIKDTSCVCGEGKVVVKDGKLVPYALIKKIDGTYEPAKRKLHPKTDQGDHTIEDVYAILDGMTHTFLTEDFYIVNIFFTEYLKRKVVKNAVAPSPNDIEGRKVEMTAKEKEIITKAYEGLQFENGKSVIMSTSYPHLNLLATMLLEKPDYKLIINGYTDNVGTAESNLLLSQNRAEAVKNYLGKQKVDVSRITTEGFGMENPIADNKTSAGRAKNRRVDFILMY